MINSESVISISKEFLEPTEYCGANINIFFLNVVSWKLSVRPHIKVQKYKQIKAYPEPREGEFLSRSH